MKNELAVLLAIILSFATGCKSAPKAASEAGAWQPWTEHIRTSEDLNAALHARWSIDRIRSYCKNVAPPKWSVQNLVAMGDVWSSELHSVKGTEFTRIYWYADVHDGKMYRYSVTAIIGDKYWILEIGNEETLQRPPDLGK